MSSVTSGHRLPRRPNVVFREPDDLSTGERLFVALVVVVVALGITWGPSLVEIVLRMVSGVR